MKMGRFWLVVPIYLLVLLCSTKSDGRESVCQSSNVVEGEDGKIIFSLGQDITLGPDHSLVVFVKKDNTPGDIVHCKRKEGALSMDCKVSHPRFKSKGLVDHQLALAFPNATADLQGRYDLYVVVNGDFEPTVSCNLTVQTSEGPELKGSEDTDHLLSIVPPVIIILTSNVVIICLIKYRRQRKDVSVKFSDGIQLSQEPEEIEDDLQRTDPTNRQTLSERDTNLDASARSDSSYMIGVDVSKESRTSETYLELQSASVK